MAKNSGNFSAIQREQEAFDSQLEQMITAHEGEFVLFKDGAPIQFFHDYQAAYREGLNRFGLEQTFLVSEVKRRRPEATSITWQLGAM